MRRLAIGPDGTVSLPKSLLSGADEVLLLEGADAVVIKKVRRSVAEKSFEEVAAPFREMAQELGLSEGGVSALIDEARAEKGSCSGEVPLAVPR